MTVMMILLSMEDEGEMQGTVSQETAALFTHSVYKSSLILASPCHEGLSKRIRKQEVRESLDEKDFLSREHVYLSSRVSGEKFKTCSLPKHERPTVTLRQIKGTKG